MERKKHAPIRERGTGGLFQVQLRGKTRWRFVISLTEERTAPDGTVRLVQLDKTGTADTPKAAEVRAYENLRKHYARRPEERALSAKDRGRTLADFYYEDYRTWYEEARNVRGKSAERNRTLIEKHVLPELGAKRLRDISLNDITVLVNQTLPAKGQGAYQCVSAWGLLGMIFKRAVKLGLMPANPIAGADRDDRPHRPRKSTFRIPPGFVDQLQSEIEGSQDECRWMLSLSYGIRGGEARGLTWDCIEGVIDCEDDRFEDAVLIIKQQLQPRTATHGPGCERGPDGFPCGTTATRCPNHETPPRTGVYIHPSTKNGETRYLPLIPWMAKLFREQWDRQQEWKKSPKWKPMAEDGLDRLVFTTVTGSPVRQQDESEQWRDLIARCGITEKLTPHKSRHIAITTLVKRRVPMSIIQLIVGHMDPKTTAMYLQLDTTDVREALSEAIGADAEERILRQHAERVANDERERLAPYRMELEAWQERRAIEIIDRVEKSAAKRDKMLTEYRREGFEWLVEYARDAKTFVYDPRLGDMPPADPDEIFGIGWKSEWTPPDYDPDDGLPEYVE